MIRRLAAVAIGLALALGPAHVRLASAGVTGVATDDAYEVNEDTELVIPAPGVLANDGPAGQPAYCVVSTDVTGLDGHLPLDSLSANGSFRFTPTADFRGSTTFTYTMGTSSGIGSSCPEGGPSNTATVTITVSSVNDPPGIALESVCQNDVTVAEDSGPFGNNGRCVEMVDFGPADENNQNFNAWLVSSNHPELFSSEPDIVAFDGLFGRLEFTPAPNATGQARVTVRGRDSGGTDNGGDNTSDPIAFDIVITGVNDAPTATADSFFALKNATLNVGAPGVLVNDRDIDSGTITAVKVTSPAHGVVTLAADGAFSYTPQAGYEGPDAFSYKASDGSLSSPTRVVSLTVTGVPPVASPTPIPTIAPTVEPSADPGSPAPSASVEPTESLDPEASPSEVASGAPSPSLGPSPEATAEPGESAGDEGLSLPVLLVIILFVILLGFAASVYVPKWIRAQSGGAPPDEV